jgi:uncharacterized protein with beta-barrel porin domain
MNNITKKSETERLIGKATLAALAAMAIVQSTAAGGVAPPPADWYQSGPDGDWFLDEPLVGQSVSADGSPFAALEIDEEEEDATIESGASWDLNLQRSTAINFEYNSTLTLDGDLTVTTDHDEVQLATSAVSFEENGILTGSGNIELTSEPDSLSSESSLITVGVLAEGELDVEGYDGSITVTNDNTNSPSEEFGEGPLGDFLGEVDLSGSAVAVGVAALDISELEGFDILGLFEGAGIVGDIDQEITVTAKSRDDLVAVGEDDYSQSLTAAIAAGVVGASEDGIVDDADITATATSGASIATLVDSDEGDSEADSIALAVGFGGATPGIAENASIAASATSGDATASTSDDELGEARAHSIAGGAGVIGFLEYGIEGDSEGEGVSITADTTSGKAKATADDYAEGTSAAISAGIGGLIGMEEEGYIANATMTATSTAGAADADALDGEANSNSVAAAAGIIGLVNVPIAGSAITATAESALSEADGYESAEATSLALAGGVLGEVVGIDSESVTTIDATATANDAIANSSGSSDADATALALGVGSIEALGYVLEAGFSDLLGGFFGSDEIESDGPSEAYGLGGDFTIVATAGTATATSADFDRDEPEGDAVESIPGGNAEAYANAYAVAFEGDVYGDVETTMDVTANAGTATATAVNYADTEADADASGIDGDVEGDVDSSITVAANGGTADSTTTGYESTADADANADASGLGGLTGSMSAASVIDVSAIAGDATATSVEDSEFPGMGGASYASARAEANGIDGTVDTAELGEPDAVEGVPVEETLSLIEGTIKADAQGGIATADAYNAAVADASVNSDGIDADEDDVVADFDASFDIDAVGGVATATSVNGTASASAEGSASAIDNINVLEGDFGGTVNVLATTDEATATGAFGADASVDTKAYGLEFDEEEDVYGNFSANLTLVATAGDAIAETTGYALIPGDAVEGDIVEGVEEEEPEETIASADAITSGLEDLDEYNGNIAGSFTQTATAGIASAYAEQEFFDFDEVEGDIVESLPVLIGMNVEASANAASNAIDGDVYGTVSADIDLTATGGFAEAENLIGEYASAEAYAETTGIAGDVDALTGSFTLVADGGTAVAEVSPSLVPTDAVESDDPEFDSGVYADASAESYAVDGDVDGDVSADFDIASTGGTALASGDEFLDREAIAYGDSSGIDGELIGDFSGEMTVVATGGTAIVEDTYDFLLLDAIDADDPGYNVYADASAIATGIGDSEDGVDGDIAGTIDVTANGGTAAFISDFPFRLPPDVIDSDGVFATDADLNAYAEAIAIDGSVESEEVSAIITATAVGGLTVQESFLFGDPIESDGPFEYEGNASALAAGIAGETVLIGDVNGGITATATAGVNGYAFGGVPMDVVDSDDPGPPEVPAVDEGYLDNAFAAGIMAYERYVEDPEDAPEGGEVEADSLLDVVISTYVHAFVKAPDEYELDEENSYAAAVYGATGDDSVELAEGADIIGDINLGGGENTLTVTGNTIMEGNILSTSLDWIDEWLNLDNGVGTVDFDIESGLFTAVRTVEVSDLAEALEIATEGGLAPVLSQDPEDGDTSLVSVRYGNNGSSADVNIGSGATVLPVFADGVDLNDVMGNEYTIVDAEGIITDNGAIVDNSETPFEYTVEVISGVPADLVEGFESTPVSGGDEYVLTVDRAKDQNEEETPGTVQANQAVNSASQAVMLDISKHASLLRSLLRRDQFTSKGAAPTGAAAPDVEKMRNGDWSSYISVFGNIGSQDSTSGFAGFDYDTYGMVLGQEKLIGEQLILGVAGSYAQTDISGSDGSGGGDSDLYSGTVYANWFTDTWYVDGGLTYGHAENDVTRVDFKSDVYSGSYDSALVGTWIEVGYTSAFGDFGLEPYGRISYVHGEHDGFTDSGPDALVLTTDDNETDNFKTEIGARMNREWVYESGSSFTVEVKAGWEHEWADEGVSINSSYLGDDALNLKSAEADADAIVLGVRAEWACGNGISVGVEYEPTISGNWYNHAFSGTLQYNW